MRGMTIKQINRSRFYALLEAYKQVDIHTPDGKIDFIRLSVALHAAKGGVPKRMWPLINEAFRERGKPVV